MGDTKCLDTWLGRGGTDFLLRRKILLYQKEKGDNHRPFLC